MIDNDVGKPAFCNEKDDAVRLQLLATTAINVHGSEYLQAELGDQPPQRTELQALRKLS